MGSSRIRRSIGIAGLLSGVSAIALQTGTQAVAWWYGYSEYLGSPLMVLSGGTPIYSPFEIVRWVMARPDLLAFKAGAAISAAMVWFVVLGLHRAKQLPWQDNSPESDITGASEWGSDRDLRRLGLLDGESGIVLGMLRNERLITYTGGAHVLFQGGTGSGKTVAGVIPSILVLDDDSLLVLDTKGENYAATGRWRASLGPCAFFDPTCVDSVRFNPFAEVSFGSADEDRELGNLCKMIVARTGTSGTDSVGQYYQRRVRPLLEALARHSFYDLGEVPTGGALRRMIPDFGGSCLKAMLRSSCRSVVDAAREFARQSEDSQKGTLDGLADVLGIFGDRLVDTATSASDFRISDLMAGDRPWTLYLRSPQSDQDRLQPLMMLITRLVLSRLMFHLRECDDGRPKKRTLTLVLEEFADANLSFVKDKLATMRGFGIRALLVAQSDLLLKEVYGPLNSIDENCDAVVAYSNIGQDEQAYVSANAGQKQETVVRVSRKQSVLWKDHEKTVSTASHKTPLLDRSAVRGLPADRQVVFVSGSRKAFLPYKPVWFAHSELARRGDDCVADPGLRPGQQSWVLERRRESVPVRRNVLAELAAETGWSAEEINLRVFEGKIASGTIRQWLAGKSKRLPESRVAAVEAALAEVRGGVAG